MRILSIDGGGIRGIIPGQVPGASGAQAIAIGTEIATNVGE